MYYDGQVHSAYCGLFSADRQAVFKAYYAFKAFGALYALGGEVFSSTDSGALHVCAAAGDGRRAALVANASGESRQVRFDVPQGIVDCRATDGDHEWERITINKNEAATMPPHAVWLVEFGSGRDALLCVSGKTII